MLLCWNAARCGAICMCEGTGECAIATAGGAVTSSYAARRPGLRHLRPRPPQPAPPVSAASWVVLGLSIPIACEGEELADGVATADLRSPSPRRCLAAGGAARNGPWHHGEPRHLGRPAPPRPPPRVALPHPPLRRGPSLQPPGDSPHSSRSAMPPTAQRSSAGGGAWHALCLFFPWWTRCARELRR
jgi:hypothetical protein